MVNSGRRRDCNQNGRRLAVVAAEHLTGRIGLHDRDCVIILVSFARLRKQPFVERSTFDFSFNHRLMMN